MKRVDADQDFFPIKNQQSSFNNRQSFQSRLKDVDLERGVVTVHAGKGGKDRLTVVPNALKDALKADMSRARGFWEDDNSRGWTKCIFFHGTIPGVAALRWAGRMVQDLIKSAE